MKLDEVDSDVIDVQALMAHIDSDLDILKELVEIFEGYYPEQLKLLGQAVEDGDCREIREIAHQFKGAVSNFYGLVAVSVAKKIEFAACERQLTEIRNCFPALEPEVIRLVENLKKLVSTPR